MENHHFLMGNSTILMAILNSYVKLPEGNRLFTTCKWDVPYWLHRCTARCCHAPRKLLACWGWMCLRLPERSSGAVEVTKKWILYINILLVVWNIFYFPLCGIILPLTFIFFKMVKTTNQITMVMIIP